MAWARDSVGRDKTDKVLSTGSVADEVCPVRTEFRLSVSTNVFELFDRMLPDLIAWQSLLPIGQAHTELPSLGRFRLRSGS
jgi:hypothetical protein